MKVARVRGGCALFVVALWAASYLTWGELGLAWAVAAALFTWVALAFLAGAVDAIPKQDDPS